MVYSDKVKIRKGGRNSVSITLDEFKNKVIEKEVARLIASGKTKKIAEKEALADIESLLYDSCDIQGDCSIEFDLENISIEDEYMEVEPGTGNLSDILGFHEINGFSFCGVNAGGDWEEAVFFIIYYDGKKFRAYSPVVGNNYNVKEKSAIGNNEDTDPDDSTCSIKLMIEDFTNRISIGGKTIAELSGTLTLTSSSKILEEDFKNDLEELLGGIQDLNEDEMIKGIIDSFIKKYDLKI